MKLVNLRHLTQKQEKTSYFNGLRISRKLRHLRKKKTSYFIGLRIFRKLRHLRHKHGKASYINGKGEIY